MTNRHDRRTTAATAPKEAPKADEASPKFNPFVDPPAAEPRMTLALTLTELKILNAALDIAVKAVGTSNTEAGMAFMAQAARLQAEAQAAFGQPQG